MEVVRERPILMSAPMVRALLNGKKSQTRRVVKPQPLIRNSYLNGSDYWMKAMATHNLLMVRHDDFEKFMPLHCPYGGVGDRLWVRETWAPAYSGSGGTHGANYKADHQAWLNGKQEWKPSIFMPRWASRITLQLTGVRIEQVQDIGTTRETTGDIIAEGVWPREWTRVDGNDRREFQRLWDELNSKRGYSWESNPWVWVLSFQVVRSGV